MAAGPRSLLAFWIGGAGAAPVTTSLGVRSLLAPWIGGASSPPTSGTQGGVRSLLAFWAGGASSLYAEPPVAPTNGSSGSGGWRRPRRYAFAHKGRLLFYDSQQQAQQAFDALAAQDAAEQAGSARGRRRARKADRAARAIEPFATVDLGSLEHYAEQAGRIEEYRSAYAALQFEALLAMFDQQREDDDITVLLLAV